MAMHDYRVKVVVPAQMKIVLVFRSQSDSNKQQGNKLPKFTLPSFEVETREWQLFS